MKDIRKTERKKTMRWKRAAAVLAVCLAALSMTACGGISEEMLEARKSAITMMENGEYEAAVEAFNGLVEKATSVTEFEVDILKYRAEAELLLDDYDAAVHTYRILMEVDKVLPEYCYFSAYAMAKDGQIDKVLELLEQGKALDSKMEAAGYFRAVSALAEAYEAGGMLEEAKERYQELIDAGHGDTNIYNRLMLMAMDLCDYEKALSLAEKGLKCQDALAVKELKFNEAVCYEFLGDFSKALELFRTYEAEFGSDERVAHEIAFLETR